MSGQVILSVVPVIAALISTGGALYIGWRHRVLTRQVAEFQGELADVTTKRQMCLSLGAKLLLVAERANEVGRSLLLVTEGVEITQDEMAKRTERFDRACDSFIEAWTEVVGWRLATKEMYVRVKQVSDSIEVARLGILLDPGDHDRHAGAFRAVAEQAHSCQRVCVGAADRLVAAHRATN